MDCMMCGGSMTPTKLTKMKSGGSWIKGAIKKPGSLRATAKAAGAITSKGTIKKSWLNEKAKGTGKTAKELDLLRLLVR